MACRSLQKHAQIYDGARPAASECLALTDKFVICSPKRMRRSCGGSQRGHRRKDPEVVSCEVKRPWSLLEQNIVSREGADERRLLVNSR